MSVCAPLARVLTEAAQKCDVRPGGAARNANGSQTLRIASSIQRASNRAPVAHTCNPSYTGGGDQEDLDLKPALGK
jgi:hypothetical protein